ncbi:hypothetical protein ADL00_38470 [Streptomyces sp. AS58]|nr:hypothetical protein ADL00_38470 [Streptomyces sp. AS58]
MFQRREQAALHPGHEIFGVAGRSGRWGRQMSGFDGHDFDAGSACAFKLLLASTGTRFVVGDG